MEQKELEVEIGTTEPERSTLKPGKVKIVDVEVIDVEKANAKKLNCHVKHPDREETVVISSVSYLLEKQVVTKGLWYNLDKEEKIQKGSALARFLESVGVKKLIDLKDKEVDTELDGNFLTFKIY